MSYRYMRLVLMFDMPQDTADLRKQYRQFRKFLLSEGFIMHQYSVYTKIALNATVQNAIIKRLQQNKPKSGIVTVLPITERQYAKLIYLTGEASQLVGNSDRRIVFLGEEDET